MRNRLDFIRNTDSEPHASRTRAILKAHPEVTRLMGKDPTTGLWTLAIVALQMGIALNIGSLPWWQFALVLYVVGATANHALWVLIHDSVHQLAFKRAWMNKLNAILCNVPIGIPGAAITFGTYHLIHHRAQGEVDRDADMPSEIEIRLVGNDPARKALWLFFYSLIQGVIRPARVQETQYSNPWVLLNILVVVAALVGVGFFGGFAGVAYLLGSTFFALGMHPFGARWIQEHFVFKQGQETYSYYGPLNRLMFNVGFHNEHHDIMSIPWSRLPKLRQAAPEFYDSLYAHRSYLKVIKDFIFDPKMSPASRVARPSRQASRVRTEAVAAIKAHESAVGLDPALAATDPAPIA